MILFSVNWNEFPKELSARKEVKNLQERDGTRHTNMGLGSKMQNSIDFMCPENKINQVGGSNIALEATR